MVSVKITVKDNGTFLYLNKLKERTVKIGNREAWNLARSGARLMKESAMQAGIKEWRKKMIAPIRAVKRNKGRYVVEIPWTVARLDIMQSHYVALKPGRLITEWARDRFGTKVVSGKSRVRYGKKGGIKGAVFVIRRPFLNRGFRRIVSRANRTVKRIAKKI